MNPVTAEASSSNPVAARPARGRWAWRVLALLVGLAVGFFAARAWFSHQGASRYDQLKTQFDQLSAQSRADTGRLQARVDTLQGELDIELGTRKGLESSLAAAQQQLGHARDQLAFFRQLFPPGPSGSVSIRALEVRQQGAALAYKVLLSRNAAAADSLFKGSLRFVAQGQEKGKAVKITLKPLRAASTTPAGTNELALSFDQFQRSEGTLALPPGFAPRSVTLSVLEGSAVRVTRTVKLPS